MPKTANILTDRIYKTIFEESPEAIVVLDKKGKLLLLNKRVEDWLGYKQGDLIGKNLARLPIVSARGKLTMMKNFGLRMLGKDVPPYDIEFVSKKHGSQLGRVRATALKDEKGKIIGGVGMVSNVTEIQVAEQKLIQERQKFKKYLDIAGFIIVVINKDQTVELINSKGAEILGHSINNIIGKNWFDNFIPKSDQEQVKSVFNQLMSGKIKPVEYFENTVVAKDGSEKLIAWHNAALIDNKGKIVGTLSSGEDISERRKEEKAIKESQERFKVLFEYAPDAYYLNDLKGAFIDGNKAAEEITGYKREELIGKSFLKLNLLPKDQIAKAAAGIAENIKGNPTGPEEYVLNKKDGKRITVEIRSTPITYGKNKMILGLARDVSFRKKSSAVQNLTIEINQALNQGKSLEEIINTASTTVKGLYGGLGLAIYLIDEEKKKLVLINEDILIAPLSKIEKLVGTKLPKLEIPLDSDHLYITQMKEKKGHLANNEKEVKDLLLSFAKSYIPDKKIISRFAGKLLDQVYKAINLQAIMTMPLMFEGEVFGILDVGSNQPFAKEDVDYLKSISQQLTSVIKRKQAENSLKSSEKRFRSIIAATPLGIHMYKLSGDGDLVFFAANPAADKILKVDNKQFVGKTIEQAFPPLAKTIVPDRYKQVIKDGKPWRAEQVTYQDGKISGVYEVYAFQISPSRMAAMFSDITKRVIVEKQRVVHSKELERLNELMVDREMKMVEMKKRFNELDNKSINRTKGGEINDKKQ